MKEMKLIVMAAFLSMLLMACELEQLLTGVEDEKTAEDVIDIDESLFAVADKDLGLTAEQSQTGVKGSMQKLGAAVEQLADQLMQLEDVVPGGDDSMNSSSSTGSTAAKLLKGDLSAIHSSLSKLSSSKVLSKMAGREEDGDIGTMIDEVMSMMTATEGDSKNVVIYKMSSDTMAELCEGEASCEKVIGNASIVQYLASETAGTLELVYADHVPLVVGYSDTEWYVETHINDVKNTVLAINTAFGGEMIHIPETMKGSVRVTLSQVDANTVSVALGVGDIHVEGMAGPEATDAILVKLDSSKILEVTSVANTKKLTVSAEIGTLAAMFHEEDGYYDSNFNYIAELKKVEINADGLTGTVELDFSVEKATITDAGLVGNGVTVKETEDGVTKTMTVKTSISSGSFAAGSDTDAFEATATAGTALEFAMSGDMFGEDGVAEQGSINVSATAGTTVEMYDPVYDASNVETSPGYIKVVAGSLSLTGTGGAGSVTIDATAGQCIGDEEAVDGPALIACP